MNQVKLLILLGVAVFATLRLQSAPPEFEITKVEKPKDKVTIEVKAEGIVFNVISSDEIGAFTAVLKSNQWPREVSVRLNRKGLEAFGFKTDNVRGQGAATGAGLTNCWAFVDGSRIAVKAKETNDGMELTFPPTLFSTTKQFGFSWIDAYRR